MSEVYFKHPRLGGRSVVIRGFKLDDGKLRCALCSKPCQPHELGTLTIKYEATGETEKHLVCLECGKKLEE
jgi:Fe2+ or Zn2+ uptake regulation protein